MATAIRQYLKDQGYGDQDIDYRNGNVTLKGKDFFATSPQAIDDPSQGLMKDTAYGDPTALSKALQTYRASERGNSLNTTQNNLVNNVNSTPFQFKAPAAFSYDQNTDPQYQNALQAALRNAQTGTSNALVGLGSRGIANSSVAVDRANQIQQRELGNVTTNVLPQLIQQAFQRYQDSANRDYQTQAANYGAGQDQIRNQSALADQLNKYGQQDSDNAYRDQAFAEQQKQNNWRAYLESVGLTGDLGDGAKSDYGLLGSRSGNLSLQGQQFQSNQQQQQFENQMALDQRERQAQQFAASQGLDWARLNQQQQQFVAEQAMKQQQLTADQALKQQQLAADGNPNSLDNQYKQAQIDSMKAKTPEASGIDEYDLLQVESLANQAGITPQKATPAQIRSFIADLKGKYGWSLEEAKGVESYLNSKKQAYDQEQAAAKAAEKPKKFGYRQFGG